MQIILFQEFGPEILRGSGNIRPAFGRKVHQIPIRPDRVDVIRHPFGSLEMEDFPILFLENMHHGQLHIVRVFLAFVIGLKGGF